ncbi:MAG TPA: hypothetical protein VF798_09170 [Burkholderiaceae bacterium]
MKETGRAKNKSLLAAGFFNNSIASRQFYCLGKDAFGMVKRLAHGPINMVSTADSLAADWANGRPGRFTQCPKLLGIVA